MEDLDNSLYTLYEALTINKQSKLCGGSKQLKIGSRKDY